MKYGLFGKIVGYSLLALGIGGCNPKVLVKNEHPRENIARFIGDGEPKHEEFERLDSLIKSADYGKGVIVGKIGEDIGRIKRYNGFNDSAFEDNIKNISSKERQLASIFFYVKALENEHKSELVGAIKCFDTAIALYPFNGEMYEYRGVLKLGVKDIKGAKSDFGISDLIDYIHKTTRPKEELGEEMFSYDDEVSL